MKLVIYQVDSFTTTIFEGNPAGVVLNADDLTEQQMQKIAREMNNSETAFIINRPGPGYDIEVRFFTPTKEVPICGHATIAAHYIYAREHGITEGVILQKTKAGILPVEVIRGKNGTRIVMTQAGIVYGSVLDGNARAKLVKGLNLDDQDLDSGLPVQIVSTGHSKVMVPIRSKSVLDAITINASLLTELSAEIGCNGFYAFTFDSQEGGILASGRMFAPAIGIAEDPVTGNANGPLGAYLTHYGRIEKRADGYTFEIKQGEAINRKGYMKVHVFSDDKGPTLVKISGNACIAFKTDMDV
jgi:PhzF family phenazine biosynthesis protein